MIAAAFLVIGGIVIILMSFTMTEGTYFYCNKTLITETTDPTAATPLSPVQHITRDLINRPGKKPGTIYESYILCT